MWSSYLCLMNSYDSVRLSKIAKVATKIAKIATWRNFANTLNQKLFGIKFCVENWYHKLNSDHAVQSKSISKIAVIIKNARFSISLTLDCVIRMKRVIPFFHTEFDPKQLSTNRLGEIPPSGDFGDFLWLLWLLKSESLVFNFSDYQGLILHSLVVILAYLNVLTHGLCWWFW